MDWAGIRKNRPLIVVFSISLALVAAISAFSFSYKGFRPFGIALLLSFALVIGTSIGLAYLNKGNKEREGRVSRFFSKRSLRNTMLAISAILAGLLFICHYVGGQDYLLEVDTLFGSSFLSPFAVFLALSGSLLFNGALVLTVISFVYPSKLLVSVRAYALFPLLLLCLLLTPASLPGLFGDLYAGAGAFDPHAFRLPLIGIEYGILLAICLITYAKPLPKIEKGFYKPLLLIAAVFLLALPNSYTFAVLFGQYQKSIQLPLDINQTHRVFIYLAFLLPIAYFFLLHPFDIPHRRALLCYIAYLALFGYIGRLRYNIWTSLETLPFHLCNTAMYVVPLTLTFKTTKVFYFTMFINVIGAFLALLMPNYDENLGVFSVRTIEFFINHLYAFFMPVLIVLLKIYPRPTIRYFLYSMIGFLCYFVLCLVLNTVGTAYGYSVDFFFLNSDYVVDQLGSWAERIFNISYSFELNGMTFTIHPPYLIAFYFVYVGFAVAMWYVYELLFVAVDEVENLLSKSALSACRRDKWREMQQGESKMEEKNAVSLDIRHLRKRYPGNDFDTVKDFSLHLDGGHIYAFLGKNGAGKSTIIKSIVGMHDFDDGSIEVCGKDIRENEIEAKSLLGFVPDHYALYESLTGRQYVNYIADLYAVPLEKRNEILASLLPRLSMEKAFDDQIGTYSHGMKQKITIISSLIHEPKVWILDEPMTGVDPISIFQIKETMRSHAQKGNIVFFSTHLIDVVSNLCDKVIMLKKGDLVYSGSISSLKKKGVNLEELFVKLNEEESDESPLKQKEN